MNKEEYKEIYSFLTTGKFSQHVDNKWKIQIETKSKKYFVQHQQLFRKPKTGNQRVIQPEQVELIIFSLHTAQESAHLGIESTYQKVKERYYWPDMKKTIEEYIKACDIC